MNDTPQTAEIAPAVDQPDVPEFAIVEIFGHRRHVGRIVEVERFGAKLLRIDVPNLGDFANGFVSHIYSGVAIFSMTPCTLDTVRRANGRVVDKLALAALIAFAALLLLLLAVAVVKGFGP